MPIVVRLQGHHKNFEILIVYSFLFTCKLNNQFTEKINYEFFKSKLQI